MTTITQQLAAALRAVLPFAERDVGELADLARDQDSEDDAMAACADVERAQDILAAYDAQEDSRNAGNNGAGSHPWVVDVEGWRVIIPRSHPAYCDTAIFDIARGLDDSDDAQHLENARRIVACVNACRGLSTEELESRHA